MRVLKRLLAILLAATLGGCASMEINSDYDPVASFSGLRTYAWMPGPQKKTGDLRIDNPLLDARVRQAVDRQLEANGYVKQPPERSDFLIGYQAAVEKKLDVYTVDHYYGYPPGWGSTRGYGAWGGTIPETHVYEYDEGSLILDIVNPQTRKLIWRGSAQAEVNRSASPEKRQERIEEAVRRMLERFPPQPGE
jgi:hypothetical protein